MEEITKCNHFALLIEVNSKFKNNHHYGCEAVEAFGFILSGKGKKSDPTDASADTWVDTPPTHHVINQ